MQAVVSSGADHTYACGCQSDVGLARCPRHGAPWIGAVALAEPVGAVGVALQAALAKRPQIPRVSQSPLRSIPRGLSRVSAGDSEVVARNWCEVGKLSHRQAVAGTLFRGELVTDAEARRRWGCTRLPARIHELRGQGVGIATLRRDGVTSYRIAMRPTPRVVSTVDTPHPPNRGTPPPISLGPIRRVA